MKTKKVWFITGASKGLGLALANKLIENGYYVAGTSRSLNALIQELGNASETFLPLEMDVTNDKDVLELLNRIYVVDRPHDELLERKSRRKQQSLLIVGSR